MTWPGRRILPGAFSPTIILAAGEYPAHVILETIMPWNLPVCADWGDLLVRVATREDCTAFIADNNLEFEEFIDVLHYLLRWGFPFQTASRELLDHDDPQEMASYEVLKRHKLMTSFDILEQGYTTEVTPGSGGTHRPCTGFCNRSLPTVPILCACRMCAARRSCRFAGRAMIPWPKLPPHSPPGWKPTWTPISGGRRGNPGRTTRQSSI